MRWEDGVSTETNIPLHEPVHYGVAEIWKNNHSSEEKYQGEVKLCILLHPEPSLELQCGPQSELKNTAKWQFFHWWHKHGHTNFSGQGGDTRRKQGTAPAALPWPPLGPLMATVNLKMCLRRLFFFNFSKWQIVFVWTEACDQLLYPVLRGTHKQPAMLWLKSTRGIQLESGLTKQANWVVRRSDCANLFFFFFSS